MESVLVQTEGPLERMTGTVAPAAVTNERLGARAAGSFKVSVSPAKPAFSGEGGLSEIAAVGPKVSSKAVPPDVMPVPTFPAKSVPSKRNVPAPEFMAEVTVSVPDHTVGESAEQGEERRSTTNATMENNLDINSVREHHGPLTV
jgi:hypothetical protein